KRVALLQTALLGDVLVATGKRNRLERYERNFLGIFQSETNDRSDLIVVDAVDERCYENDVNAGFVKIVDRAKLYVEQVSDLAMRVGIVSDSVKLQINKSQTRFRRLAAKFFRFGELDSVRRGLHRVITDFARV